LTRAPILKAPAPFPLSPSFLLGTPRSPPPTNHPRAPEAPALLAGRRAQRINAGASLLSLPPIGESIDCFGFMSSGKALASSSSYSPVNSTIFFLCLFAGYLGIPGGSFHLLKAIRSGGSLI
jgi:hypothetical protein